MKQRLQAWGNAYVLPIVGCVLTNELGEVLFLKRHSDDLGGSKWGFPGGRIEENEPAEDAVRREVMEETGIRLDELTQLGEHLIQMPHGTVHMTTYAAAVPKSAPIVLDPEEHQDFCWLAPKAALARSDMLYGVPSLLNDFGMLNDFSEDTTLADGTKITRLE